MLTEILDPKYKMALAKMLPEKIRFENRRIMEKVGFFYWKNLIVQNIETKLLTQDAEIRETSWLQIVQWAEEKLTDEQEQDYRDKIKEVCFNDWHDGKTKRAFAEYATANQRCAAMEACGMFQHLYEIESTTR